MVHHLDNTEAAVGVPRLITDRHAEDPDVSPGGPADQEVQRSSLVVSDGPLVSLLAGGEGHHQRSGLDQQDGGHGLAVFCHPRQPLDCQTSREISHFPTVGPRSHGESGLPTGGTSPVSCAQLSVPGRHLIDLLQYLDWIQYWNNNIFLANLAGLHYSCLPALPSVVQWGSVSPVCSDHHLASTTRGENNIFHVVVQHPSSNIQPQIIQTLNITKCSAIAMGP